MRITVNVYDYDKELFNSEVIQTITYDVLEFTCKHMEDDEIYKQGFNVVDENGNYLILTLLDGKTVIFMASYIGIIF